MSSFEQTPDMLDACVLRDRLEHAREQWLDCTAGTPEAEVALDGLNYLLDQVNHQGLGAEIGLLEQQDRPHE